MSCANGLLEEWRPPGIQSLRQDHHLTAGLRGLMDHRAGGDAVLFRRSSRRPHPGYSQPKSHIDPSLSMFAPNRIAGVADWLTGCHALVHYT